ncbi:hypothetical protein K438DRAFT_2030651 [Mycena galopus ATCC 62051]|nr:hypothetical protein K438DRAFT_2030651 [Mycena galopus ATCC 62051]
MTCFRSLRSSLRISHRSPGKSQVDPWALPYELWSEIFRMLDIAALVAVSRVSRAFNAHAIPVFLARHGMSAVDLYTGTFNVPGRRDIFPVLQTAFFLPPVRNLSCSVFGSRRFQIISYLALFLSQQTNLEDVHLRFSASDPFVGYGPKQQSLPRKTVQREVCRLLNCVTPSGKTVIITADRVLFSRPARGDLWHIVRPISAPPRGIRAKVRNAFATKGRKRTKTDLVLTTVGEIYGTVCHDSLVLDELRSLNVKYAPSVDEWAVVVLNASAVQSLNLTPALTATDWSDLLPLLWLPELEELSMGRETAYSAPELHDIGATDLDAFLIRHQTIERLEYLPQLSPEWAPMTGLYFPHITRLTTTPAHFIHLHHTPNSFPSLVDLNLFAPASTPVARAAAEFTAVLNLLAATSHIEGPGVQLRFPGTWIVVPPSVGLQIRCVSALLIFGDCTRDVGVLAEFISPFEPGLKLVEFQPASRRKFGDMRLVDELRRRVVWLEDVSCLRAESKKLTVPHSKLRQTVSVTYSDQ